MTEEIRDKLDHRDYINRKAKRGFGARKKELLDELRNLQWQIDHIIIRNMILRDCEEELNVLRAQYKEKVQELHGVCYDKTPKISKL